jgi:hypothetical protein
MAVDNLERTPVYLAAYCGHAAAVRLLMDAAAAARRRAGERTPPPTAAGRLGPRADAAPASMVLRSVSAADVVQLPRDRAAAAPSNRCANVPAAVPRTVCGVRLWRVRVCVRAFLRDAHVVFLL